LGQQLRAARRARNKSLEDVSNDTNIKQEYLKSLEEDNYDSLPGQVYVRGFLSSYGKYVGLDPKALVAQYDRLMAFVEETLEDAPHQRKTRRRRIIPRRVIMLLIALVLAVLWLAILLWSKKT